MSIFFILTGLITQNIIHLDKATNANVISANYLHDICDKQNGFYERIEGATDSSGYVYIADEGNSTIKLFDSSGNFIHHIGKEGFGPAELYKPNSIVTIPNSDRFFVYSNGYNKLYRKNGDFVEQIKNYPFETVQFKNQQMVFKALYVQPHRNKQSKYLRRVFDLNGKLINQIRNPQFAELHDRVAQTPMEVITDQFLKPTGYRLFKNNIFAYEQDTYTLLIYDLDMNLQYRVKRDIERVKAERIEASFKYAVTQKDREAIAYGNSLLKKIHKPYKTDIEKILGYYNNYLLVQTVSDKLNNDKKPINVKIDVLSADFRNLVSTIEIIPDEHSTVEAAYFDFGYLLIVIRNDVDGLFAKKYQLSIN